VLDPLLNAIGWLLAFFYSIFPHESYGLGVAIILLTCTVMLLVFPITAKQTRSMIAMQRVQPELKRIQQKYKDDKERQREEILKFYQENKINPLSGCFPLLLQMPVFFALYRVLHKPEDYIPSSGRFDALYEAICGTGTKCAGNALHFLGMDLTTSARNANEVANGFLETLPYFVIVGLVVLTGWYQARQTMARQAKTGQTSAINTQAQTIAKVMPIAFGFISLGIASGVVVYFVTSNLWRIGQQHFVLNKYYEEAAAAEAAKKAKKPKPDAVDTTEALPAKPPSPPRPGSAKKRPKPAARPPASTRGGETGGNGAVAPPGRTIGAGAGATPSPAARRKKKKKR
jgi:YidC/Oxa1 family membrane protein insertase